MFQAQKIVQLFQFHKGSIQTCSPLCRIAAAEFQFHKGSIQTRSIAPSALTTSHFNSIKVQFKLRKHLKDCVRN